jgi:hypothetical protein
MLASAGNVEVPAYLTIRDRGYEVTSTTDYDHTETWIAESDQARFVAENPLSLLGLIAVFEARGKNWLANDDQIEEFVAKFCSD